MIEADDITIKVQSKFLEQQSDQSKQKYAFAYRITILNNGNQTVQLLNRYWLITDGDGNKTEVSGKGVVGEQPHIEPGKSYQYTSGAILDTPVGTMQGYYEFQQDNGATFEVPINVFRLAVSNVVN